MKKIKLSYRTQKNILLIVLIILIVMALVLLEERKEQKDTIVLAGVAKSDIQTDLIVIEFEMINNANTSEQLIEKHSNLINEINLKLFNNEISTIDYKINDTANDKEMLSKLKIELKEDSSLKDTISELNNYENIKLNKLIFQVSEKKQEEIKKELIKDAIFEARENAKLVAEQQNFEIINIEEVITNEPEFKEFTRVFSNNKEINLEIINYTPPLQEIKYRINLIIKIKKNNKTYK